VNFLIVFILQNIFAPTAAIPHFNRTQRCAMCHSTTEEDKKDLYDDYMMIIIMLFDGVPPKIPFHIHSLPFG
jgi:hypothetical protein